MVVRDTGPPCALPCSARAAVPWSRLRVVPAGLGSSAVTAAAGGWTSKRGVEPIRWAGDWSHDSPRCWRCCARPASQAP